MFIQNVSWLSTGYTTLYVHQKIQLFITTAVRTSNPKSLNFLPFPFQADFLAGICCEFLSGLYTPTSNRIFNRSVTSSEWLRYNEYHTMVWVTNKTGESWAWVSIGTRVSITSSWDRDRTVFWAGGSSMVMQWECSSEKLVPTCKPGSHNMNHVISTHGSLLT
jgi:hypothetical protein